MARPHRREVLLAVGASGGVVAAETLGVLNAGVALGVILAAGVLAALNVRANQPYVQPHVLTPLPESPGEVVIAAARASQAMPPEQQKTDAA